MKKKWFGMPAVLVAVVLAVALLASSAFAAYQFLGFTTVVTVDEPLTIEMAWYDYTQPPPNLTAFWDVTGAPEADELTLTMSPAETQTMAIRISNNSYGKLAVNTQFTGAVEYFTFTGWPDSSVLKVQGSDDNPATYEWEGDVTVSCAGDAPPGDYSINVKFTRE